MHPIGESKESVSCWSFDRPTECGVVHPPIFLWLFLAFSSVQRAGFCLLLPPAHCYEGIVMWRIDF